MRQRQREIQRQTQRQRGKRIEGRRAPPPATPPMLRTDILSAFLRALSCCRVVWGWGLSWGEREREAREKTGYEPLALQAPPHTLGYIVGCDQVMGLGFGLGTPTPTPPMLRTDIFSAFLRTLSCCRDVGI